MGMGIIRWISVLSAVMQALCSPVVVKKELSQKGEALNSQANLHPHLHLWSQVLGSDRKSETMDTSGFLRMVSRLSLKDRVGSLDIRRGLRVETPRRASRGGSSIWSPPGEGLQPPPTRRTSSGRPRVLCFSTDLGRPWDFPGGAAPNYLGQWSLDFSA